MQHKFTAFVICLLLISARPVFKSENKEITKSYVHVPAKDAGHKDFYISSLEITNKQYHDFLNDLRARGESEKLWHAMVDTAKWIGVLHDNGPFAYYYFKKAAYDEYPVVNVSQEGAKLYCEWLTEKYNATARVKVHFMLPSEEQWVRAAQGGDTSAVYPWPGRSLYYEKKGKWYKTNMCNYRHQQAVKTSPVNNENADITAPSMSFTPNAYGIYNMSGNVAEMLNDKSYTKGGSWTSHADKVTIAAKEDYDPSEGGRPDVGFRPVMMTESGE